MKKIQVFMSTYNGNFNIVNQVKTILNQSNVHVLLTIRDDGSNKETLNILKKIERRYKNVEIEYGKNIGFKKSFLSLLSLMRKGMDYYAFSDQDDIWEKQKLERAIKVLDKMKSNVKLYISSIKNFNEQLKFINKKNISHYPNSLYALFTRTRFAGCTFVFSKELAELSKGYEKLNYPDNEMPEHDFLVASFAYTYGSVYLDSYSYIRHIRYSNSVTSGGNGIRKRAKVEIANTFKIKYLRTHMAQILLRASGKKKITNLKILNYLKKVAIPKKKLSDKLSLIEDIGCGNVICNMEAITKILIGNF